MSRASRPGNNFICDINTALSPLHSYPPHIQPHTHRHTTEMGCTSSMNVALTSPPAAKPSAAAASKNNNNNNNSSNNSGGEKPTPARVPSAVTTDFDASSSKAVRLPRPNFDSLADARRVRSAIFGPGTDERVLINVLCKRTMLERQAIGAAYSQLFHHELQTDIEEDTSLNFKEVLLALVKSPAERDAHFLYRSLEGTGTRNSLLIEVLCVMEGSDIHLVKEAYGRLHPTCGLDVAIKQDTSGSFRAFLTHILDGKRASKDAAVEPGVVAMDAKALYNAGEGRWGTNEDRFIEIFSHRSFPQLKAAFAEYRRMWGRGLNNDDGGDDKHDKSTDNNSNNNNNNNNNSSSNNSSSNNNSSNNKVAQSGGDIRLAVHTETSGLFRKALKAVIDYARNPPEYFARCLYAAMDGAGTDDAALMYLLVSRADVDLASIKDVYFAKYGLSLFDHVKSETSGDFQRALLALLV